MKGLKTVVLLTPRLFGHVFPLPYLARTPKRFLVRDTKHFFVFF